MEYVDIPIQWDRSKEPFIRHGREFRRKLQMNTLFQLLHMENISGYWGGSMINVIITRSDTSTELTIRGTLQVESAFHDSLIRKGFVEVISEDVQVKVFIVIFDNCRQLYPTSVNGTITISKDATTSTSKTVSTCQRPSITKSQCFFRMMQASIRELSDDLCTLLDSQDSPFADVKVRCDSVIIPAYKVILSLRSPVFADMFRSDMWENHDGTVVIEDMQPSVLRVMLQYIYSGRLEELNSSTACDLLRAADKYQLHALKQICSEYLKETVSVDNVFNILVIGDLHDHDLKIKAIDYICKCGQFSALEDSDQWKTLQAKNPALVIEVLTSVVRSFHDNKKATLKSMSSRKNI